MDLGTGEGLVTEQIFNDFDHNISLCQKAAVITVVGNSLSKKTMGLPMVYWMKN